MSMDNASANRLLAHAAKLDQTLMEKPMSEISPNLSLPLVMPAQAQKHVTVNESLLRLDALTQLCVESASRSDQPEDPLDGQAWILPEGATGPDWASQPAGVIAVFRDGFWAVFEPREGWQAFIRDESAPRWYRHNSSRRRNWISAPSIISIVEGSLGATTGSVVIEEEIAALAGSSVSSTISIPDRAIVLGVCVRTVDSISGASSFDCGIAGEGSKFGGSLGIAAGSVNLGVIGPQAFYAETPILLSANGGDFTGGSVRISIHALQIAAPL